MNNYLLLFFNLFLSEKNKTFSFLLIFFIMIIMKTKSTLKHSNIQPLISIMMVMILHFFFSISLHPFMLFGYKISCFLLCFSLVQLYNTNIQIFLHSFQRGNVKCEMKYNFSFNVSFLVFSFLMINCFNGRK